MQQLITLLHTYWTQHGLLLVTVLWPVLSAGVNWMFRFHSAEEWVAFAEKNPKLASVLRLMRALGVDPTKALIQVKSILNSKAGTKTKDNEPEAKPEPKDEPKKDTDPGASKEEETPP